MRAVASAMPVIAVGTSAGGVEALWTLLSGLPHQFPGAVLVVLHLSPHSGSNLDRVLAQRSVLPVQVAHDGESLAPGRVYVPQPDRHLMVEGTLVRVTRGPKENRVRPAINVLFRSVAESCGPRAVGVVLTGMLDDGVAGLWTIQQRGGRVFVQHPEEAFCDAMPRAALEYVKPDAVARLDGLALEITRAAQEIADSAALPVAGLGVDDR